MSNISQIIKKHYCMFPSKAKQFLFVIALLSMLLVGGCESEFIDPCVDEKRDILDEYIPLIEQMMSYSDITYRVERFGIADTLVFKGRSPERHRFVKNECPTQIVHGENYYKTYVLDDTSDSITLGLATGHQTNRLVFLYKGYGLITSQTPIFIQSIAQNISMTTGLAKDCIELSDKMYQQGALFKMMDIYRYSSDLTGASFSNIVDGYFNLEHGLVQMKIYTNSDSTILLERIFN